MKSLSNVLDVRGFTSEEVIMALKQNSGEMEKKGCLWLINDREPTDCYSYLMEHDYHFQTFIVSKNEFRVFISCG